MLLLLLFDDGNVGSNVDVTAIVDPIVENDDDGNDIAEADRDDVDD